MTRNLGKGIIVGLFTGKDTGLAMLGILDEKKGRTLIPCDGDRVCRAFDAAFGGVILQGKFHNDRIAGEPIYYLINEIGFLDSFTPVEIAPPELVAEHEGRTPEKKGGCTVIGYLPPDDPVYTRGPIVVGRRIFEPPLKKA